MSLKINTQDTEVLEAFSEALRRTGETDALYWAAERIPILLSMHPQTVESYMATRYHEV